MKKNLIKKIQNLKAKKKLKRIMLTGAQGQLGQELLPILSEIYSPTNILATDIKKKNLPPLIPFEYLNCLDSEKFQKISKSFNPCLTIHLPTLLSGDTEKAPQKALRINIQTFYNALDSSIATNSALFTPSSIATYGFNNENDRIMIRDDAVQRPEKLYGLTKTHIESVGAYFKREQGLDFRCLRYPGVFSSIMPSGGTTDYAIEMIYDAVLGRKHFCYLAEESELPFIYIDDLLGETVKFLESDLGSVRKGGYNLASFSVTPGKMFEILKERFEGFEMEYRLDHRNEIALKWPASIDTFYAEKDWGFEGEYGLEETIDCMIEDVKEKIKISNNK